MLRAIKILMDNKKFIYALGYLPKEAALDIFNKKYDGSYAFEVDFRKQTFDLEVQKKSLKSQNKKKLF